MATPTKHSGALVDELRGWASGDYGLEAAVDLLAASRVWLHRDDFRAACVRATAAHLVDSLGLARWWLDFEKAAQVADRGTLPASDSERQVLALAASLAGYPSSRPLHDLVTGLDTGNLALVLDAVAHTAGWHEHRATPDSPAGYQHTVTGHMEDTQ